MSRPSLIVRANQLPLSTTQDRPVARCSVLSILTLLIAIISPSVHAFTSADPESKVVYAGQNVTQTAFVYPKSRCTFGTQLAGCGLTDQLTLVTSPWLLVQYNMANANLRYQLSSDSILSRAVQIGYFDTYANGKSLPSETNPSDPNYDPDYCRWLTTDECYIGYEMQAAWIYFAQSEKISTAYNFHWNLSAAYYWNDKKPFSLRRPQNGDSRLQLNLMTLHEFHMTGPWYLQAELGLLGFTRKYPPFHSGAALSYRAKRFLGQFGFSATGAMDAWFARDRRDFHAEALYYPEGLHRRYSDAELRADFSIHPEIVLQYFFDL